MKKSLLQLILATAMCIFGCALLVAGLALPPAGIIDSSLLVAYGETLTFAGALIGVDYATSLAHMTADQEAFEAQRYAANGKRTMRAYLWSVCGAEYDAEHPQG